MKIEEYISYRKSKEKFNERDLSKKLENIEILIGYIFDYYKLPEEEMTKRKAGRISKYAKEKSNTLMKPNRGL